VAKFELTLLSQVLGFAVAGCFLVTVFQNLIGGGLGGESLMGALGFALVASCFVSQALLFNHNF
jgi:hypothetical protein